MSQGKEKLQISASALVELKATLFSKRREVRSQTNKASGGKDGSALTTNAVSEKTAAIWRRPPKQLRRGGRGVTARELERQRATQRSAEEEAELERSRKALEAKAALYDRLCGGEGVREGGSNSEGEEEGRYMVDFTRKIVEERKTQQLSSSTDSKPEKTDVKKEGVAEEVGEWVEYVDSFGRTRRCPKEDLPHMRNEEVKRKERSPTPDLLSEDMAMERERRRWEEEQEEKLDKPVGPVHYEELRQGEVRTHGVGYYGFSQDEEKRTEQLNLLNRLRDQTVSQRERKVKLQEKRKAQMAARLEKVRQRKQLKQPVAEENQEEEDKDDAVVESAEGGEGGGGADPIAAMIASELGQAREKAERGSEEQDSSHLMKKPYVRPWDKGKIMDPIRKRKKELEEERLSEFAPPTSYCKMGATGPPKVAKVDQTDQRGDESEPLENQDYPSATEVPKADVDQSVAGTNIASGPPPPPPPPPPQIYYQYQQPLFVGPYPYPPNMRFVIPPPPFGPPPPHGPIPNQPFGPPPPPPHGPIPNQPLQNWYQYFRPPPPTFPPPQPPNS